MIAASDKRISGIALVGRILLAAIFIIAGIGKLMNWSAMVGDLASHGVPAAPVLLGISLVIEIVGGLSILFGVQARWGALVLFLYLIPVSLVMHNFWAYLGAAHDLQMVNFLKNLAIMGGLSQIVAFGPGIFSLDESSYHRGRPPLDSRDSTIKLRRVS